MRSQTDSHRSSGYPEAWRSVIPAILAGLLWLAAPLLARGQGHPQAGVPGPARTPSPDAPTTEFYCRTPSGRIVIEWSRENVVADLSEVEKRLICGDPDPQAGDTGSVKFDHAWKEIPYPQAKYNLRNFLQERGYFEPEVLRENGTIRIRAGEPARIRELTVEGAPPELRSERRRKVVGSRMTPALLDSTERWILQRLGALGFPCPELETVADPDSGKVRIRVKTGPHQNLVEVIEEPIEDVQPGILRRYDAFQLGKPFNGDLLTVTENRISSQNIVQNIHFTGSCTPAGAVVRQETVTGPPRLLRFGFGVNTEGALVGRASWRNVRLGDTASYFELSALGSSRIQRLLAQVDWYHLPFPSRRSIRPSVELRHENEPFFETLTAGTLVSYSTSYDNETLGIGWVLGPGYDAIHTFEGAGPKNSHFLFLRNEFRLRSHDYELHPGSPRAGFDTSLVTRFNDQDLGSSVTAQTISAGMKALLNFRGYDPPLLVLGFRGGFNTTITGEELGPDTELPPSFRYFLGGWRDLRGFGRQQLPGPDGALTSLFGNLEFRLVATLPAGFEPLAFIDAGATGTEPWTLGPPLYWSPGVGMRWASPIGPFRTTIARGIASGSDSRWQFFLSFGEEF